MEVPNAVEKKNYLIVRIPAHGFRQFGEFPLRFPQFPLCDGQPMVSIIESEILICVVGDQASSAVDRMGRQAFGDWYFSQDFTSVYWITAKKKQATNQNHHHYFFSHFFPLLIEMSIELDYGSLSDRLK